MVFVLALAAAIWFLGRSMEVPAQARILMLALLYVVVLALQVALPAGNGLRELTGGSAGEWLVLGGLVVLIWGYRRGLSEVRARVRPENRRAPDPPRVDTELRRNARHIVLREIGGPGQAKLKRARVLVVGAGGLGAPVLQYLGAAGVGTLGVIDDDAVDVTNLARQVIHTDDRQGMPKVFSAQAAITAQNPNVTVRPYHRRLEADIVDDLIADYDLVLDGCDNVATRYLVNAAAARAGVPVISGALSQWEGQVATFDPAGGAPCYACVFPEAPAEGLAPSCAEAGVLGPLPGVVGAMMAVEAVKEITGAGSGLRGRMLFYDALWGENRTITTKRRPDCPVCAAARAGANRRRA